MSGLCLDNFRVPRDIEIIINIYFCFIYKGKSISYWFKYKV